MTGLMAKVELDQSKINNLDLVYFATGDKPNVAQNTAKLVIDDGYDYKKLKIGHEVLDKLSAFEVGSEFEWKIAQNISKNIKKYNKTI